MKSDTHKHSRMSLTVGLLWSAGVILWADAVNAAAVTAKDLFTNGEPIVEGCAWDAHYPYCTYGRVLAIPRLLFALVLGILLFFAVLEAANRRKIYKTTPIATRTKWLFWSSGITAIILAGLFFPPYPMDYAVGDLVVVGGAVAVGFVSFLTLAAIGRFRRPAPPKASLIWPMKIVMTKITTVLAICLFALGLWFYILNTLDRENMTDTCCRSSIPFGIKY